jgi:predicted ATP-dependent serine protease
MKKVQKIKSRLTQISNVKYEKGLFEAHKTNTPLDGLFSIDGGVPKATNWMVVGDPGVGKSTVTLDIIANAKKTGSKVLFISAEMNQVDLYLYVKSILSSENWIYSFHKKYKIMNVLNKF